MQVLGWREWVAMPQLGIKRIKAKIDTGARSSSLHAIDVETFRRGGKTFVRFGVQPLQRNSRKIIRAVAEVVEFRKVRSSSGHTSLRPVIETDVELSGERWPIELTLASRDTMGFRMLLGRASIRGRFLVDGGRSYYMGKPRKRVKKTKKKR